MQFKISLYILLLVGCMLLPGTAIGAQWGDFTYEEAGGSITITGYTCPGGAAVIPDVIDGKQVITIGSEAFSDCTGLTEVTIPGSITSIEYDAFFNCTGLTSVIIPGSVKSMGYCAFHGCTALTSVTILDGATTIGYNAFKGCTSLSSVSIPDSVTGIGASAFEGCTSLTGINLPNSLRSIPTSMLYNCPGLSSVTIPESVTSIGNYAFTRCNGLSSVTIPDSVTGIGISAFNGCRGLTSVKIGRSVTTIEKYAFYNCTGLASAFFYGNAPVVMGDFVFDNCASGFTVYYSAEATGFTNPWYGYPTAVFDPSASTTTSIVATTTTSIDSATTTSVVTSTTSTPTGAPCPAQNLLGEDTQSLEKLRTLRDGPLANSAAGRMVTHMYYKNADSINAAIDRSPALQAFARKFFKTVASQMQKKKLIICTPTY